MPSNRELEIVMKLKDEVTKRLQGIEGNIQKFANAAKEAGQTMRQVGREISQVGQNLIFMGAALTGPLALAFKSAENYSLSVSRETKRLDNAFLGLRVSIAESLVPVVHKLANVFGNLLNIWNGLSPAVREMIIQGIAVTGIFLTLGGIVLSLVGRFTRLGGIIIDLASKFILFSLANPWLVAIGVTVAALIVVFLKFRDVAIPILNAVEIAAQMVYIGFVKLIKYLLVGFDQAALGLEKFYELLGKLPGQIGEPYRQAAENIKAFRGNLESLIQAADAEAIGVQGKIQNTLSSGTGSLAQGYNAAQSAIQGFVTSLKGLGNNVKIEEVAQKFDQVKALAEGTARSLGSAFKHFLDRKSVV